MVEGEGKGRNRVGKGGEEKRGASCSHLTSVPQLELKLW